MTEVDFDRCSEQSVRFIGRQVPGLLTRRLGCVGPGTTPVDVGCSDGYLVWASLVKNHCIPPDSRMFGVDLSPISRNCAIEVVAQHIGGDSPNERTANGN